MAVTNRPVSGVGIGLRIPHYQTILTSLPKVNWFEAISENYFGQRKLPLKHLLQIREHYPIVLHGVSLSIGSTDPLNQMYLSELKNLMRHVQPAWVSDHLSWSSVDGRYCPDLLPLPFTQQALKHVVDRVKYVQDYLGCQIALENISRYVDYRHNEMSEAEFHREVAIQANCYLLVDVNNIYVNAQHHGLDPKAYIDMLPKQCIRQYHLGGYTIEGGMMIDTHAAKITEPVWALYEYALAVLGQHPTLIEWDNQLPGFSTLMEQAAQAEQAIKAQYGS